MTQDVSTRRLKTEYEIAPDGQTATVTSTFRQTATVNMQMTQPGLALRRRSSADR